MKRVVLAVIAAYLSNAILVVGTELLFSTLDSKVNTTAPLYYFVLDLITQCLYTIAAGYLCSAISRPQQFVAAASLAVLGLVIGTICLVTSWRAEPHWYGIALLALYPLCVWIGVKIFEVRTNT